MTGEDGNWSRNSSEEEAFLKKEFTSLKNEAILSINGDHDH